MKIIARYCSDFVIRGLVAMGFGPIVLAVIYGILGTCDVLESVPIEEFVLGIFTITALAFLMGGITIVYKIEELPLSKAITAHGLILYVAYAVVYLINDWIADGIVPFAIFTLVFVIGYAFIWLTIYLITKYKTDKINKNLKS